MKVFEFGARNIDERLRIAINQRKPGALNLNHHAMAASERMEYVGDREFNFRDLARFERLRFLEAVAEFASKHIAADELLVTAHFEM